MPSLSIASLVPPREHGLSGQNLSGTSHWFGDEVGISGQVWVNASGNRSGVMGTARLQGLMGKAGKDLEQRGAVEECLVPTSLVVQGLADQEVVVMTPLIIRRKSKGPVDMVVFGITDGQAIALKWARSPYLSDLSYWKHIVPEPLNQRRSTDQTEGEGSA